MSASSHPAPKRVVVRLPIDPTLTALSEHRVFVDARRVTSVQLSELAALPDLQFLELSGPAIDLSPLAASATLRDLHLDNPARLDGLDRLKQLTSFGLYYLPRIKALDQIGELGELHSLWISTPPSYDASRKCHRVQSLAPLAKLSRLQRLVLRGILPERDRLQPLETLASLQTLEVTHVFDFAVEDYAGLARALPNTSGHCLVPFFEASWAGTCDRCGGARVALTAPPPRTSRTLCPRCQRDRLDAHVERWNHALGVTS